MEAFLPVYSCGIRGSDHSDAPSIALHDILLTVRDEWIPRIPEVVHVDKSARPQFVDKETNPLFYNLIKAFQNKTGVPVLINTSLNRRGEPIVCSPEDAIHMFFNCGLEYMAIGDYLIEK